MTIFLRAAQQFLDLATRHSPIGDESTNGFEESLVVPLQGIDPLGWAVSSHKVTELPVRAVLPEEIKKVFVVAHMLVTAKFCGTRFGWTYFSKRIMEL
jgi:hypothetical protein